MKYKLIRYWHDDTYHQGIVLIPETVAERKKLETENTERRNRLWSISPFAIRRSEKHLGLETENQIKEWCGDQQ